MICCFFPLRKQIFLTLHLSLLLSACSTIFIITSNFKIGHYFFFNIVYGYHRQLYHLLPSETICCSIFLLNFDQLNGLFSTYTKVARTREFFAQTQGEKSLNFLVFGRKLKPFFSKPLSFWKF